MRNLKKSVMRRIYVIWFLRQITSPLFLKTAAVALLLGKITSYVSLKDVVTNVPVSYGLVENYGFFQSALAHTELTTQLIMLTLGILCVWLARDIVSRSISQKVYWQV